MRLQGILNRREERFRPEDNSEDGSVAISEEPLFLNWVPLSMTKKIAIYDHQ